LVVIVPKLNACAVEEGDEEAVDGGGPVKAARGECELFDDEWMEQSGEIGAWGHPDAGEGLFDGAGAPDALARFEDEDALAGACEIGGAGEAVVACAYDNGVPRLGG
jgi:hypothetical protein